MGRRSASKLQIFIFIHLLVQLTAGFVPEGLYVSNATDVLYLRKSDTGRHLSKSIYKSITGRIVGLALDEDDSKLFWSDIDEDYKGIYQASVLTNGSLTEITHLVHTDIIEINGLAIDWVSNNLYWTDGEKKTIEVMNYRTRHRRILVTEKLSIPRGIYADLTNRYLFWSDQGSQMIERSNLDGSDRRELVKGRQMPNQLAVFEGNLYWVNSDSTSLESCSLDGTNFHIHHNLTQQTNGRDLFGLTLSSDGTAYITSWINNYVISVDVKGAKNASQVSQTLGSDVLFNIVNVDKESQSSVIPNVCGRANCSHLCFPTHNSAPKCSCPSYSGLVVKNSTHCTEAEGNILLYVSADSGFVGFLHKPSNQLKFSSDFHLVGESLRPVAVAYDPVERIVYWSDVYENAIYSVNLEGTDPRIFLNSERGIGAVDGMALDHENRKLYYTNTGNTQVDDKIYSWYRIEAVDLEHPAIIRTIVTTAERPRALTLDLNDKYLYYTDWSDRARIVRTNLDGSNPTELRSGLDNPNGLALVGSGSSKRLYYIDSHFKTRVNENYSGGPRNGSIYSMRVDGSDWKNHSQDWNNAALLMTPYGLSTDGVSKIFVTDWDLESLVSIDTAAPGDNLKEILLQYIDSPMMVAYTQVSLPRQKSAISSVCKTHGCEDTCLTSRDENGVSTMKCVCNSYDHRVLTSNRTECDGSKSQLIVADMVSIRLLSLDGYDQSIYSVVHGDAGSNFVAQALDSSSNTLYYSDVNRRTVMSVGTDKDNWDDSRNLIEDQEMMADRMTVVETSNGSRLYWTDSNQGHIAYINLVNNDTQSLPKIVITGLSRPRAIKIYNSQIYWTEWGDGRAGVRRLSLDHIGAVSILSNATEIKTLITPDLKWPNGLHIDESKGRLFVADGHPTVCKIYNCSINGGDCRDVQGIDTTHIYDLFVHDDIIYFTDWNRRAVVAYSAGHRTTWPLVQDLVRPTQMIFKLQAPYTNFCAENNGGCSDVCVSLLGARRCVCRPGRILLLDDQRTCRPTEPNMKMCNVSDGSITRNYQYGKTFTPPNEKCVTCKCLAGDRGIMDSKYGQASCRRAGGGEGCPLLSCSPENNQTIISPETCCSKCVKPCGVQITNCPKQTQHLELPEHAGYVILEYLPSVRDCLGLSREIQLTRNPPTSAFAFTSPGQLQEVITTASAGQGGDSDVCRIELEVIDRTPPTIKCPDDVTLYTSSDKTVATWVAPEVYDNGGLEKDYPKSSVVWGSELSVGSHQITYIARDKAGLEASCQFTVNVDKTIISDPGCPMPQLLNAEFKCGFNQETEKDRKEQRRETRDTARERRQTSGIGTYQEKDKDGYSCTITCKDGYTYVAAIDRITCVNGKWSRSLDSGFNPCMRRQLSISGGLMVTERNACGKNVYLQFTEDFLKEKIHSKFLSDANYTFTANVKAEGCVGASSYRKVPGDVTVTILISADISDDSKANDVTAELNRLLDRIDEDIKRGFLVMLFANVEGIFSSPNPITAIMKPSFTCLPGSAPSNNSCVFCPRGTYDHRSLGTNECKPCPANTYSEKERSRKCTPCPDGLVSKPGSYILQQCVERKMDKEPLPIPGIPLWIIICGAAGGLLIVALIIALIIIKSRRQRKTTYEEPGYALTEHTSSPETRLITRAAKNEFADEMEGKNENCEEIYECATGDTDFNRPGSNGDSLKKQEINEKPGNDESFSGLKASGCKSENEYGIYPALPND